jgi:hypothetical protein
MYVLLTLDYLDVVCCLIPSQQNIVFAKIICTYRLSGPKRRYNDGENYIIRSLIILGMFAELRKVTVSMKQHAVGYYQLPKQDRTTCRSTNEPAA